MGKEGSWILALILLAIVLVIALLSRWNKQKPTAFSRSTLNDLRRLVKKASDLGTTSAQDSNALYALNHALTGLAYLQAAEAITHHSGNLSKITGMNIDSLKKQLEWQLQQAILKVKDVCPKLLPENQSFWDALKP